MPKDFLWTETPIISYFFGKKQLIIGVSVRRELLSIPVAQFMDIDLNYI
ncbi:MAG: hypothetical protein AAF847_19945 [Bacteroidota bacterium]